MLYPQNNRCRTVLDLSGFWEIKVDSDDAGSDKGWMHGFTRDAFIGVPGSWNEQLAEIGLMNYIGTLWYQTRFHIPALLSDNKLLLRVGSADFHAEAWVNGKPAGAHSGGYLPFEFDITGLINKGENNLLVIRVNNSLSHETIPQGVTLEDYIAWGKTRDQTHPPTIFDFFSYGGLNRPVKLISLGDVHLSDIRIAPSIKSSEGHLKISARFSGNPQSTTLVITLRDGSEIIETHTLVLDQPSARDEFTVPDCQFWCPENPHLYQLHFELFHADALLDEYLLDVGVREITVNGSNLILNGKPIFLKGFGKHEDFAVIGKGLCHPLVIKDFQLMKWIGANSFRTSHYPYAEEVMQMADKMGFLVIDEVPAVSLNLRHSTAGTLETHKKALSELIARDYNHPSVICWSVANEPGIWGEQEATSETAENYWTHIFNHVRSLDTTRPVTLPACAETGYEDPAFQLCDIISINRYWGWYQLPGDVEEAGEQLKTELKTFYEKFKKPVLVSEFGADTLEGEHATYPQLFTEEYQSMLIGRYFEVIEALPFMIGEHIWNFADFRTAQHHRRVILNRKGVFNRQRDPKSAAFVIRKHWTSK